MDEIRLLLMDFGIPPYFADIGFWVNPIRGYLGRPSGLVSCDGVVFRTYLASCG